MNILSSSLKRIWAAEARRAAGKTVTSFQLGMLLGAPLIGMSLAVADDVTCTYVPNGNGTQACTANLTGTTPPNQTTWDAQGNGHNGGNGWATDLLNFSLTGPGQLTDPR